MMRRYVRRNRLATVTLCGGITLGGSERPVRVLDPGRLWTVEDGLTFRPFPAEPGYGPPERGELRISGLLVIALYANVNEDTLQWLRDEPSWPVPADTAAAATYVELLAREVQQPASSAKPMGLPGWSTKAMRPLYLTIADVPASGVGRDDQDGDVRVSGDVAGGDRRSPGAPGELVVFSA